MANALDVSRGRPGLQPLGMTPMVVVHENVQEPSPNVELIDGILDCKAGLIT